MKSVGRSVESRIAILTPTLAGGGAERGALFIAAGLLERGHEVDIVLHRLVCHYPGDVPDKVRLFVLSNHRNSDTVANLEGESIVPRPLTSGPTPWQVRFPRLALVSRLHRNQMSLLLSGRPPGWAAGIAGYVHRENPTALLAINVLASTAATLAVSLMQRSPRVVATLNDVLRTKRLRARARIVYPNTDAAVAVSRGTAAELAGISGMSRDRIHTIYNPVVSMQIDRNAPGPAGHAWLDEPACPVVLAIGRMKKVKDFPTLLAAFARLVSSRPARLVILGDGPLREPHRSLAKKLGIAEHVDFPGFVDNPHAYLAKADLFVLSSRFESFSRVLVEAMCCGCPVVSTDCPYGPREILQDGRLGVLVPVGDPEALAAAMTRTLDDPPESAALRERASFFSTERAVDEYEKLLLGDDAFQRHSAGVAAESA